MLAMRRLILVSILSFAACGGNSGPGSDATPTPDAEPAPLLRNPVDLPDDQLAAKALALLGAGVPDARNSCNECHGMTRQHISYWRALSDVAMTSCLTDLTVASPESARTMIDCIRSMPELAGSDYQTSKLGIFATATTLPWFQYTMKK